jgi:hypothetical protein
MSKEINVRQLPKCTSLYTVGPQTYNPTSGGLMGLNSSFLRVKVLYRNKGCIRILNYGIKKDGKVISVLKYIK